MARGSDSTVLFAENSVTFGSRATLERLSSEVHLVADGVCFSQEAFKLRVDLGGRSEAEVVDFDWRTTGGIPGIARVDALIAVASMLHLSCWLGEALWKPGGGAASLILSRTFTTSAPQPDEVPATVAAQMCYARGCGCNHWKSHTFGQNLERTRNGERRKDQRERTRPRAAPGREGLVNAGSEHDPRH